LLRNTFDKFGANSLNYKSKSLCRLLTIQEKEAAVLGLPFLADFLASPFFVNYILLCPGAPQISGHDAECPDFF